MASALLAGCFVFFLALAIAVSSFMGQPTNLVIGDKIGIVEIYGVIADSKQVIEQLQDFRDNESIVQLVTAEWKSKEKNFPLEKHKP